MTRKSGSVTVARHMSQRRLHRSRTKVLYPSLNNGAVPDPKSALQWIALFVSVTLAV